MTRLVRGAHHIRAARWVEELGIAWALWVLEVKNFAPFLVESDLRGNSLFERGSAKIAKEWASPMRGPGRR